jgi:hypothetical protein
MADITIGSLRLEIAGAAGHEHRMRDIAVQAAAIFAARLDERCRHTDGVPRSVRVGTVTTAALHLNLNHISDNEAAMRIAQAWLGAKALHWED